MAYEETTTAGTARKGKNGRPVSMTKEAVKRRLYMREWRRRWREREWFDGPRPRYASPGRPD